MSGIGTKAIDVACTECHAPAGTPCVVTMTATGYHAARVADACRVTRDLNRRLKTESAP